MRETGDEGWNMRDMRRESKDDILYTRDEIYIRERETFIVFILFDKK